MSLFKLAIISPNKQQYSETFIQFHRTNIPAAIYYLFDGFLPRESEDGLLSYKEDRLIRFRTRLVKTFFPGKLTPHEQALAAYFQQTGIQAVLAEYGMTGAAVRKVCDHLSIPLFVHFHGYDASNRLVVDPIKEEYKKMFRTAKGVFVVSKHMYKLVEALGCPPEKMILNPYGPSDRYFSVQPAYESRNFLAIGRFVEKKAPAITIRAFAEVHKQYPDSSLYMVGSGELLNACKELVVELGISNAVHFCGVLTPDQITELMNSMSVFVQHSVTAQNGDAEGTPVAVLEAAAAALPVVATSHAGIPDVIIHGETGLLCDEHDLSGMVGNLLKILAGKDAAKQMGELSRKRVAEQFTLDRHIQCIYQTIQSGLKEKPVTTL